MAKPNVISQDELIEAAKTCIVKNGMERFTLKSVAEEAGVTQGTVYYHFRTKDQLLLNVVKCICEQSWEQLIKHDEFILKEALNSAKARCTHDSFYHRLFFTLVVSGLSNENIRKQLKQLVQHENDTLIAQIEKIWSASPIEGVSFQTWGIIFNAIIDGLAIQTLLNEDFPVEQTFMELEHFISSLSALTNKKSL